MDHHSGRPAALPDLILRRCPVLRRCPGTLRPPRSTIAKTGPVAGPALVTFMPGGMLAHRPGILVIDDSLTVHSLPGTPLAVAGMSPGQLPSRLSRREDARRRCRVSAAIRVGERRTRVSLRRCGHPTRPLGAGMGNFGLHTGGNDHPASRAQRVEIFHLWRNPVGRDHLGLPIARRCADRGTAGKARRGQPAGAGRIGVGIASEAEISRVEVLQSGPDAGTARSHHLRRLAGSSHGQDVTLLQKGTLSGGVPVRWVGQIITRSFSPNSGRVCDTPYRED